MKPLLQVPPPQPRTLRLRPRPEIWTIAACEDTKDLTRIDDVLREIREHLEHGCRTICIYKQ